MKLFHGKRLKFATIERFSPNVVLEMEKGAMVTLGSKVRVHSGSKIKVRSKGVLSIENDVHFNYNCILICRKKISIGEGTEFGPSVYIYDHDHDYKRGLKNQFFRGEEIKIGKNCWIGANTIILKGTTIGDNCVVSAGCVLNGKYNNNSRIIQKRNTIVEHINNAEH